VRLDRPGPWRLSRRTPSSPGVSITIKRAPAVFVYIRSLAPARSRIFFHFRPSSRHCWNLPGAGWTVSTWVTVGMFGSPSATKNFISSYAIYKATKLFGQSWGHPNSMSRSPSWVHTRSPCTSVESLMYFSTQLGRGSTVFPRTLNPLDRRPVRVRVRLWRQNLVAQ
jgi:hypothetical protein